MDESGWDAERSVDAKAQRTGLVLKVHGYSVAVWVWQDLTGQHWRCRVGWEGACFWVRARDVDPCTCNCTCTCTPCCCTTEGTLPDRAGGGPVYEQLPAEIDDVPPCQARADASCMGRGSTGETEVVNNTHKEMQCNASWRAELKVQKCAD